MNEVCNALVDGGVIRGVLAAVDCETRAYALLGYSALTAGSGVFQAALTALLTIYVAVVGYRMLFAQGDVRLSDAPVMALKIGAILALVTNWSNFQTLVFDVANRVPIEIAAIVAAPLQDQSASLAAAPVEGLQYAYDELGRTAEALGKKAGPSARTYANSEAAAAQAITTAGVILFIMSAGVISAATLAIGVLTAIGPVFIALFLVRAARGLFVGWVRALAAAAFTPMVGWLLIVLMLATIQPWLEALELQRPDQLDPQTAMSLAALIFVFAIGQAALVLGACVMAFGFRLSSPSQVHVAASGKSSDRATAMSEPAPSPSRAERLALELHRQSAQSTFKTLAADRLAPVGRVAAATASIAAPQRLGDTYRPAVFTPRRVGVAK
jgi:type IV secretion system protein VirB6